MIYADVIKTYGPYEGKDGRLRLILKLKNNKTKTISYPKYLMESYLNRYLTDDETVDHIDGNPLNNDIDNLRVLSRKEHCYNDVLRNKDVIVKCTFCGKEFIIKGNNIRYHNRKDKHQSGYFCSRQCSGKYGKAIQTNEISHKKVESVNIEKFKYHEN